MTRIKHANRVQGGGKNVRRNVVVVSVVEVSVVVVAFVVIL